MKKPPIVGTITRAFDGEFNGVSARLIRVRKLGYTIELFEAHPPFHAGDRLHVSLGEFTIDHAHTHHPVAADGKSCGN